MSLLYRAIFISLCETSVPDIVSLIWLLSLSKAQDIQSTDDDSPFNGYWKGNLIVNVEMGNKVGWRNFSTSSQPEVKIYDRKKHWLCNDLCILSHCHIFAQRRVASGSQESKYIYIYTYTQMNEEEEKKKKKRLKRWKKGSWEKRREERGRSRKRKRERNIARHASTCPKMPQSITLKARGRKGYVLVIYTNEQKEWKQ